MTSGARIGIVGAVAAAILIVFATRGVGTKQAVTPQPGDSQSSSSVPIVVTLPRLLDLGADKCIPCKMMQPVLADLRKEHDGKLKVEFIDVWKNPAAGEPYRIKSIPTQIFFNAEGKEVFRHMGFYAKDEIEAKMKELGFGL